MIYFPILGALALAVSTILERRELKKKINIKNFQILVFLSVVLVMIPLIYFFWNVSSEALQIRNIVIFFFIISLAFFGNFLFFYSIKKENISKLEPARVLEPLFVILLALLLSFFLEDIYERNLNVLIPALISACALIFSHIKRDHLYFSKYFIATIFGSFFFAVELVLSKLILPFYSPISFYFLRCSFVFLFSFILFKPNLERVNKKTGCWIFLIGAMWVVYRVFVYYGFLKIGIISTILMIMLGPIFVYFLAWKFLKEKISWKNIIASFIIVASVVYVMFF
jgi:drug/metabolite transporter (DMT)-like permease